MGARSVEGGCHTMDVTLGCHTSVCVCVWWSMSCLMATGAQANTLSSLVSVRAVALAANRRATSRDSVNTNSVCVCASVKELCSCGESRHIGRPKGACARWCACAGEGCCAPIQIESPPRRHHLCPTPDPGSKSDPVRPLHHRNHHPTGDWIWSNASLSLLGVKALGGVSVDPLDHHFLSKLLPVLPVHLTSRTESRL